MIIELNLTWAAAQPILTVGGISALVGLPIVAAMHFAERPRRNKYAEAWDAEQAAAAARQAKVDRANGLAAALRYVARVPELEGEVLGTGAAAQAARRQDAVEQKHRLEVLATAAADLANQP